MLNILLSILCSVGIANLLMLFGKLKRHADPDPRHAMLPVFLGNYIMATVFSYLAVPRGGFQLHAFDLGLGIAAGALFLTNFWVYQRSIVINGLAISVSVMRVAMVLPVLVSLLIFAERLKPLNFAGIALAILAFMLKPGGEGRHHLVWLIALFAVSGLTDLSLKLFKELGSGSEALWIGMVFSSALIFTAALIIIRKVKLGWLPLLFGFGLGIPNRLSTVFFLKGLATVPAAVAYPVTASGIVLVSVISDALFWKRVPVRRELLMYALLALGLILLNL
jgi:multidrug transporter EmrE-like cation transporter